MIEAARAKGPVLVVDSGNALFKFPGATDAPMQERAKFILSKMGALETKAMAVGMRDLSAGVPWLVREAKAAGIEPLSVNVQRADGAKPFKGSVIVTAGGVKVAFIGVTAPGTYGEFAGKPIVDAVKAEAAVVHGKADLVVLLAATTYADAMQLANAVGDKVDFVLQSGESRGMGMAQKGPGNWVLPSGERGRHVARVDLTLAGTGPFADVSEKERAEQQLHVIDTQLAELKRREAVATDASVKKALEKTEGEFLARRKEAQAQAKVQLKGRSFKLQFVGLGQDVVDDPKWKAEVERIEPQGSAQH